MGSMAEALRQIESRRPTAQRPELVAPEVGEEMGTGTLPHPQFPTSVDITTEPVPISSQALTIPREEFIPTPPSPEMGGEEAADPRYVALAETTISRLPVGGGGVLLLAGLDEHDVGGALRPLFPLLAERVPGRTIVVDCNGGCRMFARCCDAHASGASLGSDEALWAGAVFRSRHPRLDLLLGADTSVRDAVSPPMEPTALLGELRHAYQLVVLVGAAASDPDIVALAGECDGVYLVVRLGSTSRRCAGHAVRALHQAGARVLGWVLLDDTVGRTLVRPERPEEDAVD
jgi:hypothetical protein